MNADSKLGKNDVLIIRVCTSNRPLPLSIGTPGKPKRVLNAFGSNTVFFFGTEIKEPSSQVVFPLSPPVSVSEFVLLV